MRGRKFSIGTTSTLPSDAEGLFKKISTKAALNYLGVYQVEDKVHVYIHSKNMISSENLEKSIGELNIDYDKFEICTSFEGTVLSDHGVKLVRGGYRERKNFTDSHKGRKYWVKVSSVLPSDAEGMFEFISRKHGIHYLGIFEDECTIYIGVHLKNVLLVKKLVDIISSMDIVVESIAPTTKFVGNVFSEHGKKFVNGGARAKKTKSLGESSSEKDPVLDLSEVQPRASKKARPDNCIVIHDDFHINKTYSEATPEMFHAVWSSTDGFWSPQMWVGPIKNLKGASARTSIKPQLIKELLEEQESNCRLCKTDVFMGTYSNADVDHIIPLKHGGSCHKGNLQVLCVTCHRRKTALECKKVVTLMGSPDVKWEPEKVYMVNSHVHFEPDVVHPKNPKDALGIFGSRAGIFVLENT